MEDDMKEKTASYVVELKFSESQTLKEMLLELLMEKFCTFGGYA